MVPPGVSSTARPAPRQGEAGTASWRAEHCRLGDAALFEAQMIVDREVGDTLALSAAAQAWAAIAAAHYAAANVRYRA